MVRRYVAASIAIMVAALVAALVVHSRGSREYTAECFFRVSLPPISLVNTDVFTLNGDLANSEVGLAAHGPGLATAAAGEGMSVGQLVPATSVHAGPSAGFYTVDITDRDPARAGRLANAVCSGMVAAISQHLTSDRDAEAATLRDQIASLDRQAHAPGTDPTFAAALAQAMQRDETILAAVLSAPPDVVAVSSQAGAGSESTSDSLGRDLIVALVASVLAIFLLVLVGEIFRETRASAGRPALVEEARVMLRGRRDVGADATPARGPAEPPPGTVGRE